MQLADTPVQVIELIPPAVQTTLMGQENSERAMPLQDFLSEGMTILEAQPDAEEILVERVKRQRFAQSDGTHDDVLAMQSGH